MSNSFKQWASLFSERLFVMLQVYSDESDTHIGGTTPTVCGFIDTPENWEKFRHRWDKVLSSFSAPYFHYKEFNWNACKTSDSVYYGWTAEKRKAFLHDLALAVSISALPIGGSFRGDTIAKDKRITTFEGVIKTFYDNFCGSLDTFLPSFGGKALFIYDQSRDNPDWLCALNNAHLDCKAKDGRIGGLAFEDDLDEKHIALQAADLLAFVFRLNVKNVKGDSEATSSTVLNFILYRNSDIKLRCMGNEEWAHLINCIRDDEREKLKYWAKHGDNERKYDPARDFDSKKYAREHVHWSKF